MFYYEIIAPPNPNKNLAHYELIFYESKKTQIMISSSKLHIYETTTLKVSGHNVIFLENSRNSKQSPYNRKSQCIPVS